MRCVGRRILEVKFKKKMGKESFESEKSNIRFNRSQLAYLLILAQSLKVGYVLLRTEKV